jgi:nanoRNase/pAp phosphatase (c-di-AMP/oligoRNAs hydrolase)
MRIGVSEATKELDLRVDDAKVVIDDYEAAVKNGTSMLWIDESNGSRTGIVVEKILYFMVDADAKGGIGFGAAEQ